jgi:tetratricopeptide (TPR) repeat protein
MSAIRQQDVTAAFAEAVALHGRGRLEEAAGLYEQALRHDPKHFEALHFLGLVRSRQGRYGEAQKLIRKALNQAPDSAEANRSLGMALAAEGRHEEAMARYAKALALKPDFAEARNNLGIALAELGRHDAAIAEYRRALALQPDHAAASANLGLSLAALERHQEAISCYQAALARRPELVEAALNLGNAYFALNRLDEAEAAYERAIAIAPGYAEAHNNLGRALEARNRHEAALRCYAKAVELAPGYAGAQWNLALAHLALGDFAEGWPRYEWRFKDGVPLRALPQPLWRGEEIAGRTILVHAEQGFGDLLQVARYLPLLAQRGARILLEAPPPLLPLLENLAGVAGLFPPGETLADFDCHVPAMSLPGAFGTTLATIPAGIPYLATPAERVRRWQRELDRLAPPRIGIAWAGSATNRNDRNRSLPLALLRPFFELPGASFVSLQKELRPGDAALLDAQPGIARLGERFADFADAAAVIDGLDLVVAVDTAVAHLAGALGRPVAILLPFSAEWRWLRARPDSPWYPTARLFRQPTPGDWAAVVAALRADTAQRFGLSI